MKLDSRSVAILSGEVVDPKEQDESVSRRAGAWREQVAILLRQRGGRMLDSSGEGFLAEFANALDAACGALEIQEVLRDRGEGVPPERRMRLRMGIHLGPVHAEGERLSGAGLEVAVRLQELAKPGHVWVSADVRKRVRRRRGIRCDDVGTYELEGLPEPLRAYRLRSPSGAPRGRWIALAAVLLLALAGGLLFALVGNEDRAARRTAPALAPAPPWVAVLPFSNLSDDSAHAYFAEGISTDLISDLSRLSSMMVIARRSTLPYRGREVEVARIGRELGVRYLVQGSVRRAGDRVWIDVQLIDAQTRRPTWSERYDRALSDLFELQDELTRRIVGALGLRISASERARIDRPPTRNPEAWEYFARSSSVLDHLTPEGNARARELLERATRIDPGFADAWGRLAWTYLWEWFFLWDHTADARANAHDIATRAVALDASLGYPRSILAMVHAFSGRSDRALMQARRGALLGPSDPLGRTALGMALSFSGRAEESLAEFDVALRLDPADGTLARYAKGAAVWSLGRNEEALERVSSMVRAVPDFLPGHVLLAVLHVERGDAESARAAAAEVRRISPGFSVEAYGRTLPWTSRALNERIVRGLRRAGLD